MNIVDSIIALLTERLLQTGEWTLTVDELEDMVDPVALYRAVYELRLIGRDSYNPASAGELVGLLERVVAPDAESALRDAGLFLNHEDRIGLTDRFVRHLQRAIVVHLPEVDIFRGMIAQFRQYELSEQIYCDTYFNFERIKAACASEYAEGRSSPDVHTLTATWYLGTLVDRRIVTLREIGPALFDLLRTVGRQEGALPGIGAEARGSGRGADPGESDKAYWDDAARGGAEISAALRLFGLASDNPSRTEVQTEYRRLMRRFHPDVNPDGLEMAKRINAAYGALLTSAGRR